MTRKPPAASSSRALSVSQLTVRGPVDRLLVLFGDQLDARAPAMGDLDGKRDAVLLMEVQEESRHVPSSKQRTALFLNFV